MRTRPRAAMQRLLPVVACLVSLGVVATQRTYMRTCECEPRADGFCAFTLLLPEGSSTCPTQAPDDVSMETSNEVTSLVDVEERLDALESGVTQLTQSVDALTSHALDNAVLVTQVQNRSMELADRLNELEKSLANVTSRRNDVSNDTASRVAELGENLQRLNATLDDVREELANVSASATSLQSQVESNVIASQRATEELQSALEALQENVTSRTDAIEQHLDAVTSCARRSLLVDGSEARIGDDDVTASSEASDATAVMTRIRESDSAWCSNGEPNVDEWIQFDLREERVVLGVVTKGRVDFTQWVTSYNVQYTSHSNATDFVMFTDVVGDVQTFEGNTDQSTARTHLFWQPIRARYVRILPLTSSGNQCMRADLVGCLD